MPVVRPPSLAELNLACHRAIAEQRWTRLQLRNRLLEAQARWDQEGLVEVPEENRTDLLRQVSRHESWRRWSLPFFCRLGKLGFLYEEVATACTQLGWPRPSRISEEQRRVLLRVLEDGDHPIHLHIAEYRGAGNQWHAHVA